MRRCRRSHAASIRCITHLAILKQKCSDPRMHAAIDFLLAHELQREFRTSDLSRHLNLSTSRVLHLFHDCFGFSPSQAMKLRRLGEARQLLNSTFLSVKEIMVAVGIHDLSHFVREFKQLHGESPSELRKRQGGIPPNGGRGSRVA